MKKTKVDMLSGSITKGLLSMSIPIMIMNVMQVFFNIIDMSVLKWSSKESAVGAVGACGVLITLCTSLLIGVSAGANVVVARRIGAGNRSRANKAVSTAILTAITGGIILLVIGVYFAESFLKMTNCPQSLLKEATLYFKIYFWGIPIIMLYNFSAALLRAMGDTKRPMFFLILGGFIKAVLNILFVSLFDMSVEGVGFATILANIIISGLAFKALIDCKDVIDVDIRKLRFHILELKEILYMGIPAGLQSSLYSFANVVITTAVNSFGEAATTGVAIANQFDGILYHITYAPSLAVIPYVAQNVGAGNIERVKKIVVRAVLITSAFGALFGAFSAIFSSQLSSIMTSSPEAIMYSRQKMIIISSTYFICGINEIMGGVHKGIGKPILPTISTLVFMCLIRFPWVYFIFPLYPNLTFLYLIWPIGWILSIATLLIAYFPAISKIEAQFLKKKETVYTKETTA